MCKEDFFMQYFFETTVNEWEETVYIPTTLGKTTLAVIFLLLCLAAAFISSKATKSSKKLSTSQLAYCGMTVALGTVLSMIKLFHFPTGGSITLLSMLIITLPGFWFGPVTGIITGVAYGVFQLLIDPYVVHPMQLFIDYIFAFGALGLSGLFANAKNGLIKGYSVAILGRFVFAVISGWIFFGAYHWDNWSPFAYSLAYNAIYIFSEAAITIAILFIPSVKKAMIDVKNMAVK